MIEEDEASFFFFEGQHQQRRQGSEHLCVKCIMFNLPQDFPGKANNLEAPPAEEIRSTAATHITSLLVTCSIATMEFGMMRLRYVAMCER